MKKYAAFILLLIVMAASFGASSRTMALDSRIWGEWDIAYSPDRYPMTLWMFETNWFENKTKKDIVERLPDRDVSQSPGDSVSYIVKYQMPGLPDGFALDFPFSDLGILTIKFEEDRAVQAVYRERKDADSEYETQIEWHA